MRYHETKEQSAEILRLAIPLMARQKAAYHPLSYAIWYEHTAGINPALTEELERRLASSSPLTDADVCRLHALFILARDVDAFERIQQQLRALLDDTAEVAASAGAEVTQFGHALQNRQAQLNRSISVEAVKEIVLELLSETERMRRVTEELSQQLETSAREVRTLTEQLEQAQVEALLDPLTGLNNRRGLERRADELHLRAGGLAGASLLLADIDHFKTINDNYGHLAGDKVIRSVAQIIRANIKGRDIAARLGGEEFAVLLPQTTAEGAAALAEQIRKAVARARIRRAGRDEEAGRITLSIGVATAHADDTLDQLIERADLAMYAAKRAGRNQIYLSTHP